MDIIKNCEDKVLQEVRKVREELDFIEEEYTDFFIIDKIFSSENGGKTRIHRQLFNKNHEDIIEKINLCKNYLNNSIEIIRISIKDFQEAHGEYYKIDSSSLVFDDKNFLELLELDINTHIISKKEKDDFFINIKKLLSLKNRIFNFLYSVNMIDTTVFNKLINNLGIEELINSIGIFEIINAFGLQLEELNKFKKELKVFEEKPFEERKEKIKDFYALNSILELHKKRSINFIYAGVSYKIFLEYETDLNLKKGILINIAYLENIISSLIEQSCMDLIKKELKKGKIQKLIEVKIKKRKGKIEIIITNNGFEVKNIYHLFLSDMDNKSILEAKNLTNIINGTLDINELDVGMEYKLII